MKNIQWSWDKGVVNGEVQVSTKVFYFVDLKFARLPNHHNIIFGDYVGYLLLVITPSIFTTFGLSNWAMTEASNMKSLELFDDASC